jgi:hypothetical protein
MMVRLGNRIHWQVDQRRPDGLSITAQLAYWNKSKEGASRWQERIELANGNAK